MSRAAAGLLLAAGLPLAAAAQEAEIARGTGALLRGLDKVNASVTDLDLASGAQATFGRLTVRLNECRYPADDPAGEAYAFLVIADAATGEELFSGWMLASSPALNALEHPRYDIWVLRCKTG
ncbi:MAG: DUF2155 domain-containing protein [Roseovarius sp.]|nr:DUF2155 domain-containing protein [Roseovarius sp.]